MCILGAALNRSSTDVEAALSGFLRLIDTTPVDELLIGYDSTAQGPVGWVLFGLDEVCSVQTEHKTRRTAVMDGVPGAWTGSHDFVFTQNALCVLDPHHILTQTAINDASFNIANGVQRGLHVSAKVRELQKLLTSQRPDLSVLTAPVGDTGEAGRLEPYRRRAKVLSQLTIQRQQIATTPRIRRGNRAVRRF